MTQAKHTQGPWHRGSGAGNGRDSIFASDGRMRLDYGGTVLYPIANLVEGWDADEDNANAALIAAAPELLMALRCALADLEGIMPEMEPSGDRNHPAWTTITEAQDAIAKAEVKP